MRCEGTKSFLPSLAKSPVDLMALPQLKGMSNLSFAPRGENPTFAYTFARTSSAANE